MWRKLVSIFMIIGGIGGIIERTPTSIIFGITLIALGVRLFCIDPNKKIE